MGSFLEELKRRNVAKVALVYIIAGWLTMQVVDVMFPALKLPEWLISAVAAFVIIGFPFALIFAWAFEMTPEGIKREKDVVRDESITPQTGQRLNHAALIILAIAVAFLLVDKFMLQPEPVASDDKIVATAPDEKPSIAVLPFVNMSDDRENEYFSDGLSEELLNLLAKIPQLHVAGRTSSFKFKGTNEDLRIIGEALNVKHLLEGSVRRSGPRLRITAQLIDTENGYHLWSDTYDRDLTDIFAIQDEIAGHVVEALKAHLLGAEVAVADQGTTNVEAYNQFLRGNFFLDDTSAENLEKARAAYEMAVELDPGFARAYAGLAVALQQTYSGWATSSGGEFIENFEKIRQVADKAAELAPDHPESLIAQTVVALLVDWDLPAARASTAKALENSPNDLTALGWHGSVLLFLREFDEAEKMLRAALDVDPLSLASLRTLGDYYMVTDRCDLAVETYERALSLSPDTGRFYGRIARCKLFQGDLEAARIFNAREPVTWVRETNDLIIRGRGGATEAWLAAVADYESEYGFGNSYQMAEIFADLGDLDKTFEWLDHTARVRDPGGPWALIMPFFDEAKKDPRFNEYRAKLGL
ncbi:MAG: tetratricopeptide repeat protein [Gammaproteobacteria bacterium]|nr:tetratricopeptide repeat protein [Gammaproteobacteria bacterium]